MKSPYDFVDLRCNEFSIVEIALIVDDLAARDTGNGLEQAILPDSPGCLRKPRCH